MSIYFPSSTRAIQSTGRPLLLVGVSLALLLIGAWGSWFVLGTIPLYETSNLLVLDRDSLVDTPLIEATFPAATFAYIQQGQEAYLWLDHDTSVSRDPLLVQIYDIQVTDMHQPIHTTIWITSPAALAALPSERLVGRVRIPTKGISPMSLFLSEIRQRHVLSAD